MRISVRTRTPSRAVAHRIRRAVARGALSALLILAGCATADNEGAGDLLPSEAADADGLVIIVHGSGFGPDDWPAALETVLDPLLGSGWQTVRVDWEDLALQRLAAPRIGTTIGATIGSELAARQTRMLHLIAHSVGAFVIQGIIDEVRKAGNAETVIHATFLDPFLARSPLRPRFGARGFGQGADFAESYFTGDDAVPFTNRPLEGAWNLKLDATVPDVPDPPVDWRQLWPVSWYLDAISDRSAWGQIPGLPLIGISGDDQIVATAGQVLAERARSFPPGAVVDATQTR